jgi:leucine dehydrogenase
VRLEPRSAPGYEDLVTCRDERSGLQAVIAIHDTTRGPAVGGCRMWPYASLGEAIDDALRLARGMSYKSALAELPLGGGKAVILGHPCRDKTADLLHAFGRFVDRLEGRFMTAEDVGMSVADVETVGDATRHVAGLSRARGSSGDPSPLTAYGVFVGIRAACAHRFGSPSLTGRRIAVQGLGHVGAKLCRMLQAEGAVLFVTDVDKRRVECTLAQIDATAVDAEAILFQDVDVLAPCALGGVLSPTSVPQLRAQVVAGAANNQLSCDEQGDALAARGILYAPDFAINAGGIINIASELRGPYDPCWTRTTIEAIGPRLTEIFRESDATGVPPHRVADALARRNLGQ